MNDWKQNKNLNPDLLKQLNEMTEVETYDAFYKNLSFGTGGIRGIVGPGTNRMNIYTLRKINLGFGKYLLKQDSNPTVVIAYDSRHMSLEFAQDSARVLATLGVKVYLFKDIAPTPLLSFAVRHLHTTGGIVITASHNPPQYNGYKVYDGEGCQLVPKLVEQLNAEIQDDIDLFSIPADDFNALLETGKIIYLDDEVTKEYFDLVKNVGIFPKIKKTAKVVYTPLHGTGGKLAERLLKELGYEYYCVEKQMVPDPNFSTVKSPNPEDHNAFNLALKLAKEKDADIVLATDPDADRLGVVVKHNGEYIFLTGNQVGALMIYFLAKYHMGKGNWTVFDTIVTSPLGAKIAESFNLDHVSTLTGFKYIGEQIKLIEKSIQLFFFGYEESSGYLIKDFVRDKDALQALVLICEISSYYKQQNHTLIDTLEEIYKKYGYYEEEIVNIGFEGETGNKKMEKIIDFFRTDALKGLDISIIEDYLLSRRTGALPSKINLPKENVLKFFLSDGTWFALRPSGTEPKIKIYFSANANNKDDAVNIMAKLKNKVLEIIEGVN